MKSQMSTSFSLRSFTHYYLIHPGEAPNRWRRVAWTFSFLSLAFWGVAHILCYWHNRQVQWKRVQVVGVDQKTQEVFLSKSRLEKETSFEKLWLLASCFFQEKNEKKVKSLCKRIVSGCRDVSLRQRAETLVSSLTSLSTPLTEQALEELREKARQGQFEEIAKQLTTVDEQKQFACALFDFLQDIPDATEFLKGRMEVWVQVICVNTFLRNGVFQEMDARMEPLLFSIAEMIDSGVQKKEMHEFFLHGVLFLACRGNVSQELRQKAEEYSESDAWKISRTLRNWYLTLLLVEGRYAEMERRVAFLGMASWEEWLTASRTHFLRRCFAGQKLEEIAEFENVPRYRQLFEMARRPADFSFIASYLEKVDELLLRRKALVFFCDSVEDGELSEETLATLLQYINESLSMREGHGVAKRLLKRLLERVLHATDSAIDFSTFCELAEKDLLRGFFGPHVLFKAAEELYEQSPVFLKELLEKIVWENPSFLGALAAVYKKQEDSLSVVALYEKALDQSKDRAVTHLKSLASAKLPKAVLAGWELEGIFVKDQQESGFQQLLELYELCPEDVSVCATLHQCYKLGVGTEADPGAAEELFTQAVQEFLRDACLQERG